MTALSNSATQTAQFDADLILKYDRPTPRYTSYPPATELSPDFALADWEAAIARGNARKDPLSLYCHIPFCESACYFCGCNVIVTQQKERAADPYLDYLEKNIDRVAARIDRDRPVVQMHWGGGTPNYLPIDRIERLWNVVARNFTFAPDAELSVEINPRYVDRDYILGLRRVGFNRISFGIQDFNPQVQEAVNRVQPESLLFGVMDWIREAGFDSANVDLIYGLPHQTVASFRETLEKTLRLDPDRVAVFSFAYMPDRIPVQRNLPAEALPGPNAKLEMLHSTVEILQGGGYYFVGMDHFAKPDDELAIAQQEGKLHRNFQGYTTQPNAELLGFGLTSISMLRDVYVQNHKRLKDYYRAIDENQWPIARGVSLDPEEDLLRREIVMELMCHFRLDKQAIEAKYQLDFDRHFAVEAVELAALERDGLVTTDRRWIEVTPAGRMLVRNVASAFDAHLRQNRERRFSRAI